MVHFTVLLNISEPHYVWSSCEFGNVISASLRFGFDLEVTGEVR